MVFKTKGISLHRTIIGAFIAVCLLSSGVAGFVVYRTGHKTVDRFARQIRSDTTSKIKEYLDDFLSHPMVINGINVSLMEQGRLSPDDPISLEELFKREIDLYPTVSSVYFGNMDGGLANSGREDSDGRYVIETEGFRAGIFKKIALDDKGSRGELLSSFPGFDARTRPWFLKALEAGAPFWSDVYILFSGHDMALSASYPVYVDGKAVGVMATDLSLSRVSSFLRSIGDGGSGVSFIVDRAGDIIATSESLPIMIPSGDGAPVSRHTALTYPYPAVQEAAKIVEASGGWTAIEGIDLFDFKLNGDRMYFQASPFVDDRGIDWVVAVVIPEKDLAPGIVADRHTFISLTLGLMVFAVLLGLIFARFFTVPMSLLEGAISAMSKDSKTDPLMFPSRFKEVSMVIDSFNRMAIRMHSAMDGLKEEIARRKSVEKALTMEATTDFLTGLANRRSFMERLKTEVARIRRYRGVGSLLLLDIDRFKTINDNYGHQVGDQVLAGLGELLSGAVREGDLPGRIGGEEFLIFLSETSVEGAGHFAERLRQTIKKRTIPTDEGAVSFTVSIGITQISPDDGSIDQIIARSDRAMYRAKELGRDRVEIG
nr:diguanylate cyclase [uncultured Dethiosulfovibrio sp.]